MKVTILKKTIKEGVSPRTGNEYKIRGLFVKFTDSKIYDKIVSKLKKDGASIDQIERFCKPNEYKGEVNYAFGLNCSKFTFERVQSFGELDALIDFKLNDSGFINAKIAIKDRVEQVLEYIEPTESAEEVVEGWATKTKAPTPASKSESESDLETESTKTEVIPPMPIPTPGEVEDELPF
ncbi:MAG: hypothetical protein PHN55_12135 [Dysgonamonadaceae bacterium]|nr:hypothetical protein [Dysgonamonadaceae bacterium]